MLCFSPDIGVVKLECKSTTKSGVGFTLSGTSSNDTSKVAASMETKYKIKEYGMTLTEKWNTDNMLNTGITIEDQLVKGLKLQFDTSFVPHSV